MISAIRTIVLRTAISCLGLVVFLILPGSAVLADTRCPIKDFLKVRGDDIDENTTLLGFDADLNGDGVKEVFLAREDDLNGKAGNMWMVYVSRGDQFHLSESIPSLRADGILSLRSKNSAKVRLFQVTSPMKGQLAVLELVMSGFEISERMVATIGGFREEDADTILELLNGQNTTAICVVRGRQSDFNGCDLGRE
jgi:hypothetical protein